MTTPLTSLIERAATPLASFFGFKLSPLKEQEIKQEEIKQEEGELASFFTKTDLNQQTANHALDLLNKNTKGGVFRFVAGNDHLFLPTRSFRNHTSSRIKSSSSTRHSLKPSAPISYSRKKSSHPDFINSLKKIDVKQPAQKSAAALAILDILDGSTSFNTPAPPKHVDFLDKKLDSATPKSSFTPRKQSAKFDFTSPASKSFEFLKPLPIQKPSFTPQVILKPETPIQTQKSPLFVFKNTLDTEMTEFKTQAPNIQPPKFSDSVISTPITSRLGPKNTIQDAVPMVFLYNKVYVY